MENIPHYIFDWIEKIPFDALNPQQRTEALQYFTKEEYEQMQVATKETQAFFAEGTNVDTDAVFASLSNRFDAVYASTATPRGSLTPLLVWKVAAAVLLLVVGYLSFLVYESQPQSTGLQTVVRDTVYITQEPVVNEIKVHDTVYLKVTSKQGDKNTSTQKGEKINTPNYAINRNWGDVVPELNTLSITDINKGPNAPRNSSIENDTFIKGFNYVSL